jgi:hypothetical protein
MQIPVFLAISWRARIVLECEAVKLVSYRLLSTMVSIRSRGELFLIYAITQIIGVYTTNRKQLTNHTLYLRDG